MYKKSHSQRRATAHRKFVSIAALESRTLFSSVITVNTFTDQIDAPSSTTVSLRDAITKGEATASAVTIAVPGGTYLLKLGELAISTTTGNLTIQPVSGTPILHGDYSGRIVHVEAGANVTLHGMEISDGYTSSDAGTKYGAGVLNQGTLTITDSSIHDNTGNGGAEGTGIYNAGTMTVDHTTISNNNNMDGRGLGAGIANVGTLTITDSTISGNIAGLAGGIQNSGQLKMDGSTISNNSSYYDGGGLINTGTATLTNSTIANNRSDYSSGGVLNKDGASLTLTNCTVVGNTVSTSEQGGSAGGGIFNSGALTVANTLIAANIAENSVDDPTTLDIGPDVYGPVISKGHNLVTQLDSHSTGWTASDLTGSSQSPLDAKLSLLSNNGGPTQTIVPLPGSPAIDHGSNALAPISNVDQRGLSRIVNSTIDIGAVETQTGNAFISGTVYLDAPTGENPTSGITIYNDANNNGKFDSGEVSQVTNDLGQYNFAGLAAGNYKLRAILPAGARQVTPANNFGWTISLSAKQVLTNADFHEITTAGGAISGTIFIDANGNGKLDPGEQPQSNATPVYDDANNNGIRDGNEKYTFAGSNGYFDLTGLSPGNHEIREDIAAGWQQTIPAKNGGYPINLSTNQIVTGITFSQKALPPSGDISGTVFNDTNANGKMDSNETGRGDITIYNDANNNGKLDNGELKTTTAADGNYQLSFLPFGNYKIREVLPAGWKQTSPANNFGWTLTLSASNSFPDASFGEQSTTPTGASVSGTVFNDTNNNAKQDSSETGLSAWTVYIDLNNDGLLDNGEASTQTTATGAYSFLGLSAGTYIVRAKPQTGYSQTTPANGFGQHVTLTTNQSKTAILFGEHQT